MRGVADDLQARICDARYVDAPQQFLCVAVECARGEGQVGDLAGESTAVLLPGEDPLELALRRLREVRAAFVQEDDVHTLCIAGRRTNHDPADGVTACDLEPG